MKLKMLTEQELAELQREVSEQKSSKAVNETSVEPEIEETHDPEEEINIHIGVEDDNYVPEVIEHVKSNDVVESAVSPLDLINARKAAPGTFSVEDVIVSRDPTPKGVSVMDIIQQRQGGSNKARSVQDLIFERKYN